MNEIIRDIVNIDEYPDDQTLEAKGISYSDEEYPGPVSTPLLSTLEMRDNAPIHSTPVCPKSTRY